MNPQTENKVNRFRPLMQKLNYISKTFFLFTFFQSHQFLVDIVDATKESADFGMLSSIFRFLHENIDNTSHIVIISQDKDFYMLLNKLKRFRNTRTHLITGVEQQPFVEGLADILVFYKRAFTADDGHAGSRSVTPSPMKRKLQTQQDAGSSSILSLKKQKN